MGIHTPLTTSNKDVPSKRKLDAHLLTTPLTTSPSGKKKCIEQCHMDKGDEAPKGYRLMDMKTLGQTLALTHKCSEGECGMICNYRMENFTFLARGSMELTVYCIFSYYGYFAIHILLI